MFGILRSGTVGGGSFLDRFFFPQKWGGDIYYFGMFFFFLRPLIILGWDEQKIAIK